MVKFSCICVTFGRPQHIGEAVQCFLDQTYENKELIILNTYPRQEYVYDHPLVKVINLKERPKTHCECMHLGVLESSGDWIVPWDDDDIWLPEFLSQYGSYINNDPTLEWVRLFGRFYGGEDFIRDYKHLASYCHLFTVSRKLYNEVGGYIRSGEFFDKDICDQNLSSAILPYKGSNIKNWSADSSMIYRYIGMVYHRSNSDYTKCAEYVDDLVYFGHIPEGRIELVPALKHPWLDMAKKILPIKSHTPATKINVYVQTYTSTSISRQNELDDCLRLNKANKHINVIEVPKQDRLTFKEIMDIMRPSSNDDTISIMLNSDIILDESILLTLQMSPNDCFWLTRWEKALIDGDRLEKSYSHLIRNVNSADTWIFRGKIKEVPNIDFGFGVWGCDGALAHRLREAGYLVFNPCYSIRTYHIHGSNVRTYDTLHEAPKPWDIVYHGKLPWDNS